MLFPCFTDKEGEASLDKVAEQVGKHTLFAALLGLPFQENFVEST